MRMTLVAILSETRDILSCGLYHSPKGQLVMVDLDRADSGQLYMPDRLDEFTDGSMIWSYEYRMNVVVMKQFCLMVTERLACNLDMAETTLMNFADLLLGSGGPWQGTKRSLS